MSIGQVQYILQHYERNYRQIGHTTIAVKKCLKMKGLYLVGYENECRQLKKEYPKLKVMTVNTFFNQQYLLGRAEPLFFDHAICEQIVRQLHDKV